MAEKRLAEIEVAFLITDFALRSCANSLYYFFQPKPFCGNMFSLFILTTILLVLAATYFA